MANVNGTEINLMPTKGMRAEAERYRAWKAEGRKGGTSVAARRATQILSGKELSPATVLVMSAWFARHEVDKQGEGYSPGSPAYPSPGRVAWAAWGGDHGKTWADAKAKTIKSATDRLHNTTTMAVMDATADQQRELTPDLTAPQVALYEALEEIVDDLGKFDQGIGAHGAHYMPVSPFASEGMQCSNCIFYAGPRACEVVAGDIAPEGACKFWIIPEQLLTPQADASAEGRTATSADEVRLAAKSVRDYAAQRAAAGELSEGDFVAWQSSGGTARGRIEHVMRTGTLGVPGSDFSIDASADDPAALIRIYRPKQDGWSETETLVGHKFSTLRKIEPLDEPSDDEDDDRTAPSDLEQRPYPNEHAVRLVDPGQFDRFRRKNNDFAQGIDSIYGIKGDDPVRLQALRFDAARFTVSEAKKWLSDHDYKPISFEPATGKSMDGKIDIKAISKEVLRREAPQGLRVEESTEAGLTFSFSSEAPVERWWGREVLMHDDGAMDLARMNDGGPWLWNHNRDVVLGVAEKAWLGDDRRLYVKTKWSPNTTEKGTEEYKRRRDIEAGIVRNVSFAYEINDVREAPNGDMQVVGWNVLEVSSVSVPADQTVGLGRALDDTNTSPTPLTTQETNQASTPTLETKQTAERGADFPQDPPSMEQATNVQEVQSAARQSERERVAAIRAMCAQHQIGTDLADTLIDNESTLDQAREAVLNQIGRTRVEVQGRVHDDDSAALGLTDKEVRSFSFVRALNHLINPGDRAAREAAAFEIEVGKAAADKYQRSSNGIVIPNEVLRRDLVVGTSTAGGNLVSTDLLSGSFIDLLRNRMAMMQAGVTMLSGLQGNISLPRQSSAATAYWVGENASPTESQQSIDQVNMTPKTVGAFVDYSRRLLLQASIDVESMIRADLAKIIALELDRAAIYGTGSTNQPLGLTNTTGIGAQTISTFGTFAEYIGMETDVATANADAGSMRYIINAAARGALKSTSVAGTEAKFVYENDEINGYPVIVSNQLTTNDCLFGDFSQFVVGMWSGLDLTVDPYAGSTAGTVRVIALQDVDFAVKQPGAFCFGT
jgi:HK97 family phage major capsid protein